MKLSEGQIRFIDTYLKNSGVKYVDVRYEMTDHVAAALEAMDGDFDENFRQYMLENKMNLLESNRQFGRIADKRAWKMLLRNLIKPRFILIFSGVFAAILAAFRLFGVGTIVEYLNGFYFLAVLILLLVYWFFRPETRAKFSIAEKVLGTAAVLAYITTFWIDPLAQNDMLTIAYYACFSAFFAEAILTYRQLAKKYKLQYGS